MSQSFLITIDSLENEIAHTNKQSKKSELYLELARVYSQHDDSIAKKYVLLSESYFKPSDVLEEAEYLHKTASIHRNLEMYDSALACYVKIKNLPGIKNYPEMVARTYYNEGKCRFSLGHIIECNPPLRKAITIYDALGLYVKQAECLNLLGQSQQFLGNYNGALKHYFSALELYDSTSNQDGKAEVLTNIATVYNFQKDYQLALETFDKALEILHLLNDKIGEADCYSKRGEVYLDQKNYQNALNENLKALKILKTIEDDKLEALSMYNIGRIYEMQNDPDVAINYYNKALRIHEDNKNIYGKSLAHLSLGRVYLQNNNKERAGQLLLTALKEAKPTGSADVLMEVYESLSSYYAVTGQTQKFQESWKNFKTIHDTLYTSDKAKDLKAIQTLYNLKKSEEIDQIRLSKEDLEAQLESARENQKLKERQFYYIVIFLLVCLAITLLILVRSARRSKKRMELKNRELQETLLSKEEKEVLLKEVHHRVKNNMQIITSLLRLQSVNIEDEYIQNLYQESQNRIKTMALVHEELYQTKDLTELNVKNYLEKLIENLILNYSLHTKIHVNNTISVQKLGIDTLIPLGLLLNEIISNSFKHAFVGQDTGSIYVTIERTEDDALLLKVGDDGIGFDHNPADTESLGYELIESLVEQLEGTMEVKSDKGVHYEIRFFEQEK